MGEDLGRRVVDTGKKVTKTAWNVGKWFIPGYIPLRLGYEGAKLGWKVATYIPRKIIGKAKNVGAAVAERIHDTAESGMGRVRDVASGVRDRVEDATGGVRDRVSGAASNMAERVGLRKPHDMEHVSARKLREELEEGGGTYEKVKERVRQVVEGRELASAVAGSISETEIENKKSVLLGMEDDDIDGLDETQKELVSQVKQLQEQIDAGGDKAEQLQQVQGMLVRQWMVNEKLSTMDETEKASLLGSRVQEITNKVVEVMAHGMPNIGGIRNWENMEGVAQGKLVLSPEEYAQMMLLPEDQRPQNWQNYRIAVKEELFNSLMEQAEAEKAIVIDGNKVSALASEVIEQARNDTRVSVGSILDALKDGKDVDMEWVNDALNKMNTVEERKQFRKLVAEHLLFGRVSNNEMVQGMQSLLKDIEDDELSDVDNIVENLKDLDTNTSDDSKNVVRAYLLMRLAGIKDLENIDESQYEKLCEILDRWYSTDGSDSVSSVFDKLNEICGDDGEAHPLVELITNSLEDFRDDWNTDGKFYKMINQLDNTENFKAVYLLHLLHWMQDGVTIDNEGRVILQDTIAAGDGTSRRVEWNDTIKDYMQNWVHALNGDEGQSWITAIAGQREEVTSWEDLPDDWFISERLQDKEAKSQKTINNMTELTQGNPDLARKLFDLGLSPAEINAALEASEESVLKAVFSGTKSVAGRILRVISTAVASGAVIAFGTAVFGSGAAVAIGAGFAALSIFNAVRGLAALGKEGIGTIWDTAKWSKDMMMATLSKDRANQAELKDRYEKEIKQRMRRLWGVLLGAGVGSGLTFVFGPVTAAIIPVVGEGARVLYNVGETMRRRSKMREMLNEIANGTVEGMSEEEKAQKRTEMMKLLEENRLEWFNAVLAGLTIGSAVSAAYMKFTHTDPLINKIKSQMAESEKENKSKEKKSKENKSKENKSKEKKSKEKNKSKENKSKEKIESVGADDGIAGASAEDLLKHVPSGGIHVAISGGERVMPIASAEDGNVIVVQSDHGSGTIFGWLYGFLTGQSEPPPSVDGSRNNQWGILGDIYHVGNAKDWTHVFDSMLKQPGGKEVLAEWAQVNGQEPDQFGQWLHSATKVKFTPGVIGWFAQYGGVNNTAGKTKT